MRARAVVAVVAVSAVVAWCAALLPAAAQGGPVTVTTGRSWAVTAASLDQPLSAPAGPAGTAVDLPAASCSPVPVQVPAPAAGEGVLSVTMAAPGTDWSSPTDTSVTVDLRVDAGPAQQVVLFYGARSFRYEGFVGALARGSHCVSVSVRPDISHVTTATPEVQVFAVSLGIVPAGSPGYLLETHDPVLYGRSTSAVGDTPLITYGEQAADPDGVDSDLAYTVIWTHEDVGDGVVPAYEWGLWGRMTDIETVLHEKVAPDGRILGATYLSCGCESAPVYPDIVPEDPAAGGETDKPYPSSGATPGVGQHLALRDATGNNDVSPYGTTAYRFQQTLVTGPAPGQAREVAMDGNPWTYAVSNGEVTRETVQSNDPRNFLAGQYPQYLVVDIDSRPSGTGSVSVEVQLDNGAWYSNDYAQMTAPGPPTTFPFYNGGHQRTVVKLPADWHSQTITGLRLRLNAAQPGTTPTLAPNPSIQLIEVVAAAAGWSVVSRPVPPVAVTYGTQLVPGALGH